jgi:D-alanine-D-alanine ligase
MPIFHVAIVYNEPALSPDHPDYASEAGVLESVDAVERALLAAGRQVTRVGVASAPRAAVLALLMERLTALGPDVVFNLFEGLGGVGEGEAQVTGLIELLGFSITGSPAATLEIARDKARAKWLLAGAGLPTAPFSFVERGAPFDREQFSALLSAGPVIVKPAREDASLGIDRDSVAFDLTALERQVERVAARYGDTLIECFIAGREFNVAIAGWPKPRLLPLAEIEFDRRLPPAECLVTYEAKWSPASAADRATPPRCPADVSPGLAERIGAAALGAYRALGCRDYARVDLRIDAAEQIFILEVNSNPDIGPEAGLARAVAASGQSYERFLCEVADAAWARNTARLA